MKRLLLILALCSPAWASTQFFLTTQTPGEAGAYLPCVNTDRALHTQRGAGVTTSVTASAASGTDIATTDISGGNELCFASDPVLATTTIANSAGSVTFNIWGLESAAACNCSIRVKVYKYDGATETLIVDAASATEFTTNSAISFTGTPSATTLNAGNRLVVRTRVTNAGGTMASGRSFTMNYAGTTAAASGDSFVTFTENIPLVRTRTVKSAGGDYATLNAWNTGEAGNLTTLNEVRQAELYAFQDTTAVSMTATWVTTATDYVRIYTVAAARHAGVYDTTKYRLEVSAAIGMNIATDFVKVEGLQIQVTTTSGTPDGIGWKGQTTGATAQFDKNIIVGVLSGTTLNAVGILTNTPVAGTSTANIYDNILYGWVNGTNNTSGLSSLASTTVNAYNNTIYNGWIGYNVIGGTFHAVNNIANNCNNGFNGVFDGTSNFNTSDIAADAPGANSLNGTPVTFVNAAANNFQPASADTIAQGTGTTDPGSGLFSDDIAGTARSAPWDMGAFKAQPAANPHPHTLTTLGVGF